MPEDNVVTMPQVVDSGDVKLAHLLKNEKVSRSASLGSEGS
jgi:hypothetical protein